MAESTPEIPLQYLVKMFIRSGKRACRQLCTPFSHSGKWCMSMSIMPSQQWQKSVCCASVKPGSLGVSVLQSYRGARITVASHMHNSGDLTQSRFMIQLRTASAMLIACRRCEGR